MLWTILIVLIALWLIGLLADVAGAFIHLLLVAALVVFLVNLFRGRTTTL
jgi:predicted membrane metal-binding protein